jgi:hypothetical protein
MRFRARLKNVGPEPGGILHVAAKTESGGLLVVEVWESEAAREQWARNVDKAIQELGGPKRPQPRKCEVHNILTAETMSHTLVARSRSTPRATSGKKKSAKKTTRLAYERVDKRAKSSKKKK